MPDIPQKDPHTVCFAWALCDSTKATQTSMGGLESADGKSASLFTQVMNDVSTAYFGTETSPAEGTLNYYIQEMQSEIDGGDSDSIKASKVSLYQQQMSLANTEMQQATQTLNGASSSSSNQVSSDQSNLQSTQTVSSSGAGVLGYNGNQLMQSM